MSTKFSYNFEWDPVKARSNLKKHGISFELATTVFHDPLALSIPDSEHSHDEERWITLGTVEDKRLVVVVHTIVEMASNSAVIRIISARKATSMERKQYEGE